MASKKKKLFAIIDIETTGGMARRDKITEVAIVLHDGKKVLDQFDSLINPERSIPYEITRITGITNEMVKEAPKFYEIAKKIVEMTEGAIFVAHNVRFDYSFIKEEFARLGYTYTRKQLCTVRMSRKAFPGLKSYSLGNLIKHFDIQVSARHRALDDTLATVELFEKMLHHSNYKEDVHVMINQGIREQKLPESISLETLESLPEQPGVYYFHNELGQVVYVGKSINIKNRVKQHFSKITNKSNALIRQVNNITVEITGSELIALLLESEEIKNLQPIINKTQRNKDYPYFIHSFLDEDGFMVFDLIKNTNKNRSGKDIVSYYSSITSGKNALSQIRTMFTLCETKLWVRGKMTERCVYYMMEDCKGACQGLESALDYNDRAEIAKQFFQRTFNEDFIILTEGRSEEETGIILVKDGFYKGYGYMLSSDLSLGKEEMMEAIDYKMSNVECNGIINHYLHTHNDIRIINL